MKCDKGDRRPIVRPERSSSEKYLEFQILAGSRKGSRLGGFAVKYTCAAGGQEPVMARTGQKDEMQMLVCNKKSGLQPKFGISHRLDLKDRPRRLHQQHARESHTLCGMPSSDPVARVAKRI